MPNNSNFDSFYEPPTKEFIQNSLMYGLDSNNVADSGLRPALSAEYSYSNNETVLGKKGRLERNMIALANAIKGKIKSIPFLYKYALYVKKGLLKLGLSGTHSDASKLDLSGIMGLEVTDFILRLYDLALNRPPNDEDWKKLKWLLSSGATREAVAYIICTSKEFAGRVQVAHINRYRRAYWNYRLSDGLRRLPVIGWIWAVISMPDRIYKLATEEKIRQVDRSLLERQYYEVLLAKFNTLQDRLETVYSETDTNFGDLNLQMKMLSSQINVIQDQVELANQNIIHANVKLDETGILIENAANRSKPAFYGFSDGVTVIQTKDYILGVPSEEWRLAMFLRTYGHMEIGTENYFRSILREGMNVVDVGANLGIYTLHALAARCFVYAYEPTPKTFKILLDNIGINGFEPYGRSTAYNLAVSDVEGETKLAVYDNLFQNNTIFPVNADDKTIDVKTVSLDNHLSHLPHIDVVKIDVEGAESLVLKGMQNIISNNPDIKIIMEFAPRHIERSGRTPLDFIHDIRDMGLDIHLIDEDSGEIRVIGDKELCGVFSVNVLLVKSSEEKSP